MKRYARFRKKQEEGKYLLNGLMSGIRRNEKLYEPQQNEMIIEHVKIVNWLLLNTAKCVELL